MPGWRGISIAVTRFVSASAITWRSTNTMDAETQSWIKMFMFPLAFSFWWSIFLHV
jgi:hypothetical protein